MTWLTWRQFRTQAVILYAALAALAAALAVTGPRLADLAKTSGGAFFDELATSRGNTMLYQVGLVAVIALPAVIGVFWGAPLIARELETGTHRLAWNQTVTRTRWLATKLALTSAAALTATGAVSLAFTWWCHPIDHAVDAGQADGSLLAVPRVAPPVFDGHGIVPVGYAALAFALGVTAGVVIRRTVPAMAVTLAVFVALQVAVPLWVRPHLASPDHLMTALTQTNVRQFRGDPATHRIEQMVAEFDKPGVWHLSAKLVDSGGRTVGVLPSWAGDCAPTLPGDPDDRTSGQRQACFARVAKEGYHQVDTYQPASRFWTLQWRETGIYIGLAALLTGFCFWRVRRLS